MKLELKHLACYLPYGLKYLDKDTSEVTIMRSLSSEINLVDMGWGNAHDLKEFKPLLRPLSDLTKEIEQNGVKFSLSWMITHGAHNKFWLKENFNIDFLYCHDLEILLKFHFDVFGLIEQGLAIDLNTIKN